MFRIARGRSVRPIFGSLQPVFRPIVRSNASPHRSIGTVSGAKPADVAFVFDIDGVLIKGKKPIREATAALTYLAEKKVPYVLMTNGGGVLESDRVAYLNKLLGLDEKHQIYTNQIIQSHTPLRTLIHKHRRVLVVGGPADKSRDVALHYGFKEVLRPVDIVRANPSLCPHHRYTQQEIEEWALPPEVSKVSVDGSHKNEPIDSVLLFNDPREMFSDIQIMLDLLVSEHGLLGTKRVKHSSDPAIPMVFSNNDFYWANDYPQPRLGQGAVKICLDSLYSACNGGLPMTSLTLGKPFKVSYDYAHHILIDWRQKLLSGDPSALVSEACIPQLNDPPLQSPFKTVYMVGDNPASDIRGGNDYGWQTILVRTGVYKDGDFERDPSMAQPNFGVFDNVRDGVFAALDANGL